MEDNFDEQHKVDAAKICLFYWALKCRVYYIVKSMN